MEGGGLVVGGKYHVVQLIGQGGMGAVYDAVNAKTGRRVALKLIKEQGLSLGSSSRQRFAREVRAAGAIDSLYVVQVLDAGEDEASGMPYLVMEYLHGENLRSILARGVLPPERAVAIAIEVCLGLVKAHAAAIVHRDLKPANLFLAETDGDRRLVKILDFGIAKVLHDETDNADLTTTGDFVGSPPYMSPEQLASPHAVDHRSDLWSLGVVLYEMLSGAVPTAGVHPIGARVFAICNTPAQPLDPQRTGASPALIALVQRSLSLDPAARFASAEEMLGALRALLPADAERADTMLGASSSRVPASAPLSGDTALALAATERDLPRAGWSARGRWAAFASAALLTVAGFFLVRQAYPSAAAPAAPPAAEASAAEIPVAPPAAGPANGSAALAPSSAAPVRSALPAHAPLGGGTRKSVIRRSKSEAPLSPAAPTAVANTGREQL